MKVKELIKFLESAENKNLEVYVIEDESGVPMRVGYPFFAKVKGMRYTTNEDEVESKESNALCLSFSMLNL